MIFCQGRTVITYCVLYLHRVSLNLMNSSIKSKFLTMEIVDHLLHPFNMYPMLFVNGWSLLNSCHGDSFVYTPRTCWLKSYEKKDVFLILTKRNKLVRLLAFSRACITGCSGVPSGDEDHVIGLEIA